MLSPWSWLWAALLAPLVLLYILKRRRIERRVGSTLLWDAALRDLRAERPWRRLRPYVSLLLQALAILLGVAALSRPVGGMEVPRGAQTVVVVDASASMSAVDVRGRSRIDEARLVVDELIAGLPPGGSLMLVAAGAAPQVLTPMTADGKALTAARDALVVRGARADLQAAVALASDRLRGAPTGSRILLLSDLAGEGSIEDRSLTAPLQLRVLGADPEGDDSLDNTGIVDFELRARVEPSQRDRVEAFVRIAHHGRRPIELYLTLLVAEAPGRAPAEDPPRTLASRRVRLEPGKSEAFVLPLELPPDDRGVTPHVEARLSALDSPKPLADALALDNQAFAAGPGSARLPVFLIGAGQHALERALLADPRVELFRTTLERLAEGDKDAPALDGWLIFAGEVPERPPAGDTLVVAPTGDRVFELTLQEPSATEIVSWDELDPALRFVQLADVHLGEARPVESPVGRGLVRTRAGVVAARVERPAGESTVLAFDPDRSDWPRQPSFVVFVRNLIERARAHRVAGGLAPGGLGDPLSIPSRAGQELRIRTPDDQTLAVDAQGELTVVPIDPTVGLYGIERDEQQLVAFRSLLDRTESDLTARIATGGREANGDAIVLEEVAPVELWPWLAMTLLALLLLETLWATRRGAA